MPKTKSIEKTKKFAPKFDKNGLIPVIAQDSRTSQILMFAYMNKKALNETIKTGFAVYYSRSRKKLWKKGEKSGHFQKVKQILVDCDQDCLILKVSVKAGQCHAGYQSCFYRSIAKSSPKNLKFLAKKVFRPADIY